MITGDKLGSKKTKCAFCRKDFFKIRSYFAHANEKHKPGKWNYEDFMTKNLLHEKFNRLKVSEMLEVLYE